jgi:hypothetical protein
MLCNHIETDIPSGSGKSGWKLGDRIVRRKDVYKQESPLRHGAIIRCYRLDGCQFGPYDEMYDVRFDDGEIECGFLGHGFAKE